MTNTTPDLLPCPFCGSAFDLTDNGAQFVHPVTPCFGRHITITVTDSHRIAAWNTRTPTPDPRADIAAVQPDPNAGAVKVKPLDLSNLLKHAFMCGWYASETISSSSEYNWTEYDPTDNDAYARIIAALEPHPDPRDEVIARLVEALSGIEYACNQVAATRTHDVYLAMIDSGQADALLALDSRRKSARAALAAAKAVHDA